MLPGTDVVGTVRRFRAELGGGGERLRRCDRDWGDEGEYEYEEKSDWGDALKMV